MCFCLFVLANILKNSDVYGSLHGQVALLFLTAGALFHERSWALWFSQAAELLPLGSLLIEASAGSGAPL